MASIEPDGKSFSPTFGTGGMLTIATTGTPTDLARQSDGKLLVNARAASGAEVRRLNANGTLDATFGNAGSFIDARFTSSRISQQKDGRIVVLGGAGNDMTLVRLWN